MERGRTDCSFGKVEGLAKAFGLKPYDLLRFHADRLEELATGRVVTSTVVDMEQGVRINFYKQERELAQRELAAKDRELSACEERVALLTEKVEFYQFKLDQLDNRNTA